jgi:hypothetical protein
MERPYLSIILIISKIESVKVPKHSSSKAVLHLCFKTFKVKTHKHYNPRMRATSVRQLMRNKLKGSMMKKRLEEKNLERTR